MALCIQLNELALTWTRLMLATWAELPALVLLENVPGLRSRAPLVLAQVRALLRAAGYVLTEQSHDCGELGGLAQRRRRYLLVARLPGRCPPVLYQPPPRRVRGCGDVLTRLPVPGTAAARPLGPMHELPKLSWRNWLRLALIPAGGDWRDLEGVLADGEAPRPAFARHGVPGPNGALASLTGYDSIQAIAAPRVDYAFDAGYGVLGWRDPARTIAATSAVGCGAYAVADPRMHDAPPCGGIWTGDPSKKPPFAPVIVAADGTWHRPLTALELAALQGFPMQVRGKPLMLAGTSRNGWRRRIGNAIPPPTARAIAEQMLVALTEAACGTFSLSGNQVWVAPGRDRVPLTPGSVQLPS